MILFIIGAILFISLVLVHEWGHFYAARKNGVAVEEFGLGFPPKAKVLGKKNGTIYTLNWLPLGGFVRLKGEHDSDTQKGSFGAASTRVKALIMLAGVGMNLVTAYVLFTIVALIGMPVVLDNQFTVPRDTKAVVRSFDKGIVTVGEVVKGSPAEKIGITVGDQIVSINGVTIDTPEHLSQQTAANSGKQVHIVVKHNNVTDNRTVTLSTAKAHLGVGPDGLEVRRSTWSAPIVAAGVTKDITVATFRGLGQAVKGLGSLIAGLVTHNNAARKNGQTAATEQVSGPVGIVRILYEGSKLGVGFMLFIIAVISLTLAIMNVLPLPALDGGRLYTLLIFRVIKKPLTQTIEERIQMAGFAVIMLLVVLVTAVDVSRLISK